MRLSLWISHALIIHTASLSPSPTPDYSQCAIGSAACAFTRVVEINGTNTTFAYNLSTLCRPVSFEYNVTGLGGFNNWTFNVCGRASTVCSWQESNVATQYYSSGASVMVFGPSPTINPDSPYACINADTGKSMTCTQMCEVVGTPFYTIDAVNASDPNSTIMITYAPNP